MVGSRDPLDVVEIADRDAGESQPLAQQRRLQEFRSRGRHAVDRRRADHHHFGAGVDAVLVGGQEDVLQIADRQLAFDPVMSVDGLRITGEVLERGRHSERIGRLGIRGTGGLHPAHVRGAHRTGQDWLFGPRLVGAAPAGIAEHILDRGEVLNPAGGSERLTGDASAKLSYRGVPRRAHADRVGKQRRIEWMTESVHRVDTKQDRDVEPRLLNGECLDAVVGHRPIAAGVADSARVARVEGHVGTAGENGAGVIVNQDGLHSDGIGIAEAPRTGGAAHAGGHVGDENLVHLADLLGQGHLAEQILDAVLDRAGLVQISRPGTGGAGAPHQERADRRGGDEQPETTGSVHAHIVRLKYDGRPASPHE